MFTVQRTGNQYGVVDSNGEFTGFIGKKAEAQEEADRLNKLADGGNADDEANKSSDKVVGEVSSESEETNKIEGNAHARAPFGESKDKEDPDTAQGAKSSDTKPQAGEAVGGVKRPQLTDKGWLV